MTEYDYGVAKQIYIKICSEMTGASNSTEEERRKLFSFAAKICLEAAEEFHKECSE